MEQTHFERTGKYRILVVDDDLEILDALAGVLRRDLPSIVDTASAPTEAIAMSGRQPYDLVLTDYQMPVMSGVELLRHLQVTAPETARILITAVADVGVAAEAINDGHVTAFLPKPIHTEKLVRAVRDALSARENALIRARGQEQSFRVFQKESIASGLNAPARPFVGSLRSDKDDADAKGRKP